MNLIDTHCHVISPDQSTPLPVISPDQAQVPPGAARREAVGLGLVAPGHRGGPVAADGQGRDPRRPSWCRPPRPTATTTPTSWTAAARWPERFVAVGTFDPLAADAASAGGWRTTVAAWPGSALHHRQHHASPGRVVRRTRDVTTSGARRPSSTSPSACRCASARRRQATAVGSRAVPVGQVLLDHMGYPDIAASPARPGGGRRAGSVPGAAPQAHPPEPGATACAGERGGRVPRSRGRGLRCGADRLGFELSRRRAVADRAR